jgi:hypothetical protein
VVWLLLWVGVAIYGLTGLVILIVAVVRWLRLLPQSKHDPPHHRWRIWRLGKDRPETM